MNTIKQKQKRLRRHKFMGVKQKHNLLAENMVNSSKQTIEERACLIARYIIDSKDTVRGAAKKFRNK